MGGEKFRFRVSKILRSRTAYYVYEGTILTGPTPIKPRSGFAENMRITACKSPRMLPITSADEADGMCLLFLLF